ncbi:hypothetical protein Nepgr_030901 [Nepenthes gracilis]|uniref:Uncharacterized protein n=1 Tax=Nepenthes gracilis TaxID=150966 RepID=A0AAD3TFM1_NEPGR|nr:hypothetical protein Nepgr_030901 [Nepenthes gracilis]
MRLGFKLCHVPKAAAASSDWSADFYPWFWLVISCKMWKSHAAARFMLPSVCCSNRRDLLNALIHSDRLEALVLATGHAAKRRNGVIFGTALILAPSPGLLLDCAEFYVNKMVDLPSYIGCGFAIFLNHGNLGCSVGLSITSGGAHVEMREEVLVLLFDLCCYRRVAPYTMKHYGPLK